MGNEKITEFRSDYAIPPGETLRETIEVLGMTQAELAERLGRPKKTVNEIIRGKASLTPETAIQLERVLGVPASFWNNLERNYREDLARLKESEQRTKQVDWLEKIPYRAMMAYGWIPKVKAKVEVVEKALDFFGVASPEAWESLWTAPTAFYRKSAIFDSAPGSIAAWLRKGELEAKQIACQPYNERAFRNALNSIRKMTSSSPEEFVPQLQELCAGCGVAVVFVRELPKLPVSGATRWLSLDSALVQLSLRYRTDDHLWFSFFHEAAHVILHGKKFIFLEGSKEESAMEQAANDFAADQLIPREDLHRFLTNLKGRNPSEMAVRDFASSLGIAPGVVVGRLQHDGVIPYSHFNGLKRHFEWGS